MRGSHRLLSCHDLLLLLLRLLLSVAIVGPDHGGGAHGDWLLLVADVGRHGLDDAAAWKSNLWHDDWHSSSCANLLNNLESSLQYELYLLGNIVFFF